MQYFAWALAVNFPIMLFKQTGKLCSAEALHINFLLKTDLMVTSTAAIYAALL